MPSSAISRGTDRLFIYLSLYLSLFFHFLGWNGIEPHYDERVPHDLPDGDIEGLSGNLYGSKEEIKKGSRLPNS